MGSIETPNIPELIDHILKGQVDGESPILHNACFCVIGNEGMHSYLLSETCIWESTVSNKVEQAGRLHSAAYGWRDLARSLPVTEDSLFWIASLTKLSTAVAVLTLDQNVREIVPELADLDVLEGFDDDGAPRLRKCKTPISLRQLLSHSSGFCYDKQHEGLLRWAAYVGKEENTFTGSYKGYLQPLIFEPGQGWAYGPGMDWAGRTIEVVTKQDLESFMRTNIWIPLKMASTTFRPWIRSDLEAKLVEMALRNPDGTITKGKIPFGYPAADCCGGVGLYSTLADQAKLLSALLHDGGGIISEGSLNELLRPQTADESHFNSMMCGPKRAHLGQTWPEGSKGHFGLSSSINAESFPGRRAAKSANWQGMPGIHTWLDRTEGLAGLYITQVLPPGDEVVTNCFRVLEEAVYQLHVPCTEEKKVYSV